MTKYLWTYYAHGGNYLKVELKASNTKSAEKKLLQLVKGFYTYGRPYEKTDFNIHSIEVIIPLLGEIVCQQKKSLKHN